MRQAPAAPGKPPAPAKSITISEATNGKCPQSSAGAVVRGSVTSINVPTVSVSTSSAPPTAIPVDPKTEYLKQTSESALIITPGVCLSAVGTVDPGGALQSNSATVGPAVNGACPGT